ncbi:MAG: DUF4011 domain-containing protein [Candidatus Lokiarchaeota archaeon]|nr:DUF4011 domain-containing protein [Candidatus Lokiarchaeota archaeon]
MITEDTIIDEKIEYWKKKLIDLSKRNNLISYRFTKSKSIKIEDPDIKKILESLEIEQDIYFQKKDAPALKGIFWTSSEDDKITDKKLHQLYLRAKENFRELGISTLFVSIGMLSYADKDQSKVKINSPIFLFPVEILRLPRVTKNYHRYYIGSSSGDLELNFALKEKLYADYGIKLDVLEEYDIKKYFEYLKEITSGLPDWELSTDIYLDIFSFQKFIMYQDLTDHVDLIKNNSLVQAYVGNINALENDMTPFLWENFDDASSIDVLQADSSQKRAIELGKSGISYVLQGPPGTGKSQTISNLIAALIEKNKKILFVSQKIAALKVVHKRLEELGLGRYCLNLHSYKGQKRNIIGQLIKELHSSPHISDEVKRFSLTNYLTKQAELNQYYLDISKKRAPWDLSIYEIRGEIAKRHHLKYLDVPLTNTIALSSNQFFNLVDNLKIFDVIFKKVKNPIMNLYNAYNLENYTPLLKNKFNDDLKNLNQLFEQVKVFLTEFERSCQVKLETFDQLINVSKIITKIKEFEVMQYPDFLICKDFDAFNKNITTLFTQLKKINDLRLKILQDVNKEFLDLDTKQIEEIFVNSSFLSRLLDADYKDNKALLDQHAKRKLTHKEWLAILFMKSNILQTEKQIEEFVLFNEEFVKLLGVYNNFEYISLFYEQIKNLSKIYELVRIISLNNDFEIIKHLISKSDTENEILMRYFDMVENINDYFNLPVLNINRLDSFSAGVEELKENQQYLEDIIIFKKEFNKSSQEIKDTIVAYLKSDNQDGYVDSFLKTFYYQILDQLSGENLIITPKQGVEKFREEDFKVRDIQRLKIMDHVEQTQPKIEYQSFGSTEVSILQRESQKKSKLKPIRRLLLEIENLIFTLKPCFMMSPLTVSQYIDPEKMKFDVVIFDEASQILPGDAVVCLMRAGQAIIMGDTQQLPPTTFFMSDEDLDVEEEIEDLESFLSEASTRFRSISLDWHYRSKNENLIAFSNYQFYNNRLITFPNHDTSGKTGIEFVYVENGVYDRGKTRTNRIEASKIVEIYENIVKEEPDKSIGIIALSQAQQDVIKDLFIERKINIDDQVDPEIEDLFIKNLETVQGDERDIIILGIGYGKDAVGKFSYNFGPINRHNGYKRLNVAITRARYKVIVVCSFQPEILDDSRINNDGLKYLKKYLEFSKYQDITKFLPKSEKISFDTSFEEAVHDTLIEEKYGFNSQVGSSNYKIDFAIKHPDHSEKYILGIECDGSQIHSSRFARDRDKNRHNFLKYLGWNMHRIWSDDWIFNKEHELERIKNKINDILTNKDPEEVVTKNEEKLTEVKEINDFEEVSLAEKFQKYKSIDIAKLRRQFKITISREKAARQKKKYKISQIKDLSFEILKVESPMEENLLFQKILDVYGAKKDSIITDAFLEAFRDLRETYEIHRYDKTISLQDLNFYIEPRISTEKQRPFELIPKEELAGAIIFIIGNAMSITNEDLAKDVARALYDNKRMSNKIKEKVEEVIKYLEEKEIIQIDDDNILLRESITKS